MCNRLRLSSFCSLLCLVPLSSVIGSIGAVISVVGDISIESGEIRIHQDITFNILQDGEFTGLSLPNWVVGDGTSTFAYFDSQKLLYDLNGMPTGLSLLEFVDNGDSLGLSTGFFGDSIS